MKLSLEERLEKETKELNEAKEEQKRLKKEIRELQKMLERKVNTLKICEYEIDVEKHLIKKIEKEMGR